LIQPLITGVARVGHIDRGASDRRTQTAADAAEHGAGIVSTERCNLCGLLPVRLPLSNALAKGQKHGLSSRPSPESVSYSP